ncbi:MAG: hypothetical protein U0Q18_04560 [Bryobacteraceae bacterium]
MPNRVDFLTRRTFGLSLCGAPLSLMLNAQEAESMPWNQAATVARVYLAGKPHWPMPTLDISAEMKEVEAGLADVSRKNAANVRLTGGELLGSDAEVKPWLDKMGDVDGVLIIPLTQPTPALGTLVDALTVPSVFFYRPYSTHAWANIAGYQAAGKRIEIVASGSYGELDPYMRAFRTVRHLRRSKVLVGVSRPEARSGLADAYGSRYGTAFRYVGMKDLQAAYEAADARQAQTEAEAFTRAALRVIEPKPSEILSGVRFYLGLKNLMRAEKANAFTIDCFGSLPANTLPGYPCIAWSKLNDAGLYGVCEADLHSTMTQLLVSSYAGVPGFVSDPVFDASINEVIHAHCVSATKMKGPAGPASPYIIRNHLETNEGAVLQVLMPAGETITVARFADPSRMLVSTAEVIGPGDNQRGCRSQIRTRVADASRWLHNYSSGLHRVIFYGDHIRTIEMLGRMMAFGVTHEA